MITKKQLIEKSHFESNTKMAKLFKHFTPIPIRPYIYENIFELGGYTLATNNTTTITIKTDKRDFELTNQCKRNKRNFYRDLLSQSYHLENFYKTVPKKFELTPQFIKIYKNIYKKMLHKRMLRYINICGFNVNLNDFRKILYVLSYYKTNIFYMDTIYLIDYICIKINDIEILICDKLSNSYPKEYILLNLNPIQ